MKISVTITADGREVTSLSIDQGESLEVALAWSNRDGSPRPMGTAEIQVETYRQGAAAPLEGGASYGPFLNEEGASSTRLLLTPEASAALEPGWYRIRIVERRAGSNPDTVSTADIPLWVDRPSE